MDTRIRARARENSGVETPENGWKQDYEIHAWTGGDVPPKVCLQADFFQIRRAMFLGQVQTYFYYWGHRPDVDTARIFKRRAHLDAWRTYTNGRRKKIA